MLETVILIRNIFYKFFFIGLILYIFTAVIFLFHNEWVINLITNIYHITRPEIYLLITYAIGWSKMITIFLFLIPALGLHWTGHNLKKIKAK